MKEQPPFPFIYRPDWVAKAAQEGCKDFMQVFINSLPESMQKDFKAVEERFSIFYFGAFEHAINTILRNCLDDAITSIELDVRNLQKVTAQIKKETKKRK